MSNESKPIAPLPVTAVPVEEGKPVCKPCQINAFTSIADAICRDGEAQGGVPGGSCDVLSNKLKTNEIDLPTYVKELRHATPDIQKQALDVLIGLGKEKGILDPNFTPEGETK